MAFAEPSTEVAVSLRSLIIQKVAQSGGYFKSQQRGEPDLTYQEKYDIADKLLKDKPSIFLSRFGKYLSEADLMYFESMKDDYMITFHLKELKQINDDKKNKTKVRNRRYEAMKELLDQGSYFSDEEMKQRDPLLYEQMVGQYLSPEEVNDMVDKADLRFSSILTKHMDVLQSNIIYGLQKEIEENQMEEDEDSEDDEEQEEEMEEGEEGGENKPVISTEEKNMLRAEFLRTMQLKFLDGEPDYDYSNIDGNVKYDSLDIRERDEQEKYFDEEDNETRNSSKSSSTGDLTFLTPGQFKNMKKLSDKMSPLALTDDTTKQTSKRENSCVPEQMQVNSDNRITAEPGKNDGYTGDFENSGNIRFTDAELSSDGNIIMDSKNTGNETEVHSNKETS